MRRSLAFVGVVFFTVQMIASAVPLTFLWWSAALFLLLFILTYTTGFLQKNPYIKTFVITGLVAFLYHLAFTAVFVTPMQAYIGEDVALDAVVLETEPSYTDGVYNARVKVTQVNGYVVHLPENAMIYAMPECTPGMQVQFYATGVEGTPAQRAQGTFFTAEYTGGLAVVGEKILPSVFFTKLRTAFAANIRALLPGESGALLCAMTVGERTYISQTQTDAFRKAGAAHILVVSGLHLAVVSGVAFFLFRRRRKTAAVVASCVTASFMLLAGMTPSVLRAGITLLIVYMGILWKAQSDPATSLGFAALLLTVQNPFSALNAGLLLSFTATIGVLVGLALQENWLWHHMDAGAAKKKCLQIGMLVAVPFTISLTTMPVIAAFGFSYSLGTFLSSIVMIPLLTPILVCGMIIAVFGNIPFMLPAVKVCGLMAGLLLRFIQALAQELAAVPFLVYQVGGGYFFAATVCLAVVALVLWQQKARHGVTVFCAFLVLAFATYTALDEGVAHILVTGSAQSAAVVLWQKDKTVVVLQNVSQEDDILSAMAENNRFSIDYLVDMRTNVSAPLPESLAANKTITVQKDLCNSGIYTVTSDTMLYIKRQAHGSILCIDINGYKLLLCNGKTNVAPYAAVDVYIAGATQPTGLNASQTICAASPQTPLHADATVCTQITVRPGASVNMKGDE